MILTASFLGIHLRLVWSENIIPKRELSLTHIQGDRTYQMGCERGSV